MSSTFTVFFNNNGAYIDLCMFGFFGVFGNILLYSSVVMFNDKLYSV